MSDSIMSLNAEHVRELVECSSIDPAVIAERGYVTVGRPKSTLPGAFGMDAREQLKALGFPSWAIREEYFYPGLLIPQYTPSGRKYAGQWKPRNAVPNREGKRMKYASAKGPARLDVHPRWSVGARDAVVPPIQDTARRLWITEGVKKADALTSRGEVTVALAGVYNWRNTHATLGDWEDIPLKGREVIVCFDADAVTKPHVAQAMARLGKWLKHKGATPRYVLPPGGPKGVDDFFASGGTLAELEAAITGRPPQVLADEDVFTDSALADLVATAVLEDQYVRTTGLGWMGWNGRHWRPIDHGEVTEAVRGFFRERYAEALEDDASAAREGRAVDSVRTEGWRKVQSASKINAVLSLAGNIQGVLVDASVFDTDPDILNTPGGVLDLRTGEVSDHDPSYWCSKMTGAAYRPGAESAAFKAALEAVPDEALNWLQLRLGQAITGYPTDDGTMLLLTGGGNNGKTVLLGSAFRALGSYARKIPNALLLKGKNPGGATPEKMTLRGTRLAYMEETPEEGHLDANMVKEIFDAEVIDGRDLYKSTVEWTPTHSLFLNTNHAPHVSDTGDGTWRRLLRLDFPYRYRGPGQPLERPTDRVGDPVLKAALGQQEAREAVLAWLVAGARRWYDAGQTLSDAAGLPDVVMDSVRRWREASDDVLRCLSALCEVDASRWVSSDRLYQEYRAWAQREGSRAMSSREWSKRLLDHSALPGTVYAKVVRRSAEGGSWPAWHPAPTDGPEQFRVIMGLTFR